MDLLIPFKAKAVCFVDERDADFSLRLVQPEDWRPWMESEMEAAIRNDVFGWALREKRPVMVPSSDGRMRFLLHAMTTTRVCGMFLGVLPLEGDEIHDVYWSLLSIVLQRSANALESFELYRIIKFSNITLKEQIKERANLLEYMTWFDQLTGLPNKAMLVNRLESEFSAMESGTSGAVSLLVTDLDRFKDFNEALGRQAADQSLRKVGRRIVETVKDSGVVTR